MRAALAAPVRALLRGVVLALLAGLLVTVTSGATGEQAGGVVRTTLAGQDARLTLPTGDAEPRGLAVYFHGQGGGVDDKIDGHFFSALRRDGWAIASSSFHAESWGSPPSTADAELLTDWAEEQVGIPTTMWVSGSMGAAVSLNAILHGAPVPPCWYGVKPAIALTQMHDVPAATRNIAEAFRGPVPAERDPVRNLGRLPDDVRYRVVASEDDELVGLRDNGGALVWSLTNRGVDISYLLVSGNHDDPSHFQGADLLDFATSCRVGATSVEAAD